MTWTQDVLGEPFEQLTLPLGADDEGDVVATLVRARHHRTSIQTILTEHHPLRDVDVLYVHGWSDYFFQRSMAKYWTDRGADFYALDLRKYGRSLRPGQTPGFITDLHTYDEDLAAAMDAMGHPVNDPEASSSRRRLVLLGHSTGGLVLSLWANRHPGVASAVILNSPWLEFQLNATTRTIVAPVVGLQAKRRPFETLPQVDFGFYARAQNEVRDTPLDVNLEWRPEHTMPVHAGWLAAVLAGHARVAAGLKIDVPICVLLSTKTALPTKWSDALTESDTVLVVDDIARAALKLGASVTIERIPGALHDIFLSRPDARDTAYERMDRFVHGTLVTKRSPVSPGAYP